ncbi:tRNA glutamyl-Q(34) synthetase GluQRS [Halomonas sp. Bachu 37]|uniref:tRNA glutamyl-Q(34) synthetase GluQRS n=1 Tax=Halomonas kashgarensis TaxID=3084920 RepID=UPI0032169C0A
MTHSSAYRGRFAPTPSGPLHFGSLVAALGSFLDARAAGGEWYVRIEDIDPPRCPAGADDTILRQLERFGLEWDGTVMYQSRRDAAYAETLERLEQLDLVYPCSCSRKQWRDYPIYPGWCRTAVCDPRKPQAWRLRSDRGACPHQWTDRLFGVQNLDPEALGDVVLRRKDGLWAYQLAVVVDDGAQHITDVVRGVDLLDNTPWQRLLQHALGLPEPRYLHLPLIVTSEGQKLSKQNLAPALPEQPDRIRRLLVQALQALDQAPPAELAEADVATQLQWAISHWRVDALRPSPHRVQTTHAQE